ncbi:restriction endonuclease [Thermincola ferriacetica]|uniref:Restriction endonuclease n=1 Tax=Thermincola ferriacetica TaxID=281456 RepID=A0A0L6W3N3_9FIRM|nr:restriction endonuclease [Thermincola ferriacetica]KNZ70150.1 restriction endonuclease [Thermincola ferriacetica]
MVSYAITVYDFVLVLWTIVLSVFLMFGAGIYYTRYLRYKQRYKNIRSADIYQIDHLAEEQFVLLLIRMFEWQGFLVKKIGGESAGQGGIDLILHKGTKKIAVVIKHTLPRYRVGSRAVLTAGNGSDVYGCTEGMVITNGFFTPKAQEAAQQLEVLLFDRGDLLGLLSYFRANKSKMPGRSSKVQMQQVGKERVA